jgi:hypothetical protein
VPDHPQWEYCEIRQDIATGIMHDQYVLFYNVDGTSDREPFNNRDNTIARLGLQGWELVAAVGGFDEGSSGFRMFFKRRLSDK